jgi:hypothetical protein
MTAKSYSCRVRLISDNADFHYEHGWWNLLREDLRALLSMSTVRRIPVELMVMGE